MDVDMGGIGSNEGENKSKYYKQFCFSLFSLILMIDIHIALEFTLANYRNLFKLMVNMSSAVVSAQAMYEGRSHDLV